MELWSCALSMRRTQILNSLEKKKLRENYVKENMFLNCRKFTLNGLSGVLLIDVFFRIIIIIVYTFYAVLNSCKLARLYAKFFNKGLINNNIICAVYCSSICF
jgi:hypothetical protein